ncbi:MAG TPA: glycosyltransferase family 2 protein [Blastocatellia bacterium]|nr:glycosyltransferase family 2 protein [Blastocatellia bacterium]
MASKIIFIASIALLAYTYVGYSALVFLLSRFFARPVVKADITPNVSVIIAAYNEERDIARKIENTLALDYPKEKLEIIVASDCSTDGTDAIVRGFADRGVILHRRPERIGKSVAQNQAMRFSKGSVLVFSDATTMYERDTLRKIVRSFADPEVGCVAGRLVYVSGADAAVGKGCRSYWGYEVFLKECESRLGSLIGVSGCLYAVRRSSYARIALDMSSDFVIATEIHLLGMRTVYDPEAISTENTNKRGKDEFRMRVRVIEQTMSALGRYREVLNPLRHGIYAVQMVSHKVMRYSAPLFMCALFVSNLVLINESEFYLLTFLAQSLFYLAAFAGWMCSRAGLKIGMLALPYYFALANFASVVAFAKFMRGEAHVTWEPLRETSPTQGG